MARKIAECVRCERTRPIVGHGLCNPCYVSNYRRSRPRNPISRPSPPIEPPAPPPPPAPPADAPEVEVTVGSGIRVKVSALAAAAILRRRSG